MREQFEQRNFNAEHTAFIDAANVIISEYKAQGFTLTLRQLYYQFVARDKIANKQTEYKRLGDIISKARIAGLIDWSAIEDRTRNVERVSTWDDPADIINAVEHSYKEDVWKDQKYRVEVWIEKEALVGVIAGVCAELRVPLSGLPGLHESERTLRCRKAICTIRAAGQNRPRFPPWRS